MKAHLETHHRLPSDIIALVGDHAAVNGCISNKIKCPIIGCASHRFNLAVDCWLEKNPRYMEIIELVWEVMKKARTLKVAAKLRDLECLAAVEYVKTRWSSKWAMLHRYIKIEDTIKSVGDLEDMALTGSKKRALMELAGHFGKFNSVTKALQTKLVPLHVIRDVFDSIIEDYPAMKRHLQPNASCLNNPHFESGVVKILKQRAEEMTEEEIAECYHLRKDQIYRIEDNSELEEIECTKDKASKPKSYFEICYKKKKKSEDSNSSYIDCTCISGTSNSCERLFSECKYVLQDHRRSLSPYMFECLMYLKKNSMHWDVKTVAAAMKKSQPSTERHILGDPDIYYSHSSSSDSDGIEIEVK